MATEQSPEVKKTNMSPMLAVGIGCVVIIIIVSVVVALVGGYLAKRVGTSLLQSAIENKTGVKANLQDLKDGKMTFTDSKTGQTVDIGTSKLPDSFPKDLEVYPSSKVVSSVAGGGKDTGFFITFSTEDDVAKVVSFYKNSLKTNGWEIASTSEMGPLTNFTITKESWEGSISISGDTNKKETAIIVTLGENNK